MSSVASTRPRGPVSSLVHRLPEPSVTAQRRFTFVAALTQAGIAVTGAVVRVTGSGLGCPTWPQCFPGSFVPTGETVPALHQAIEFSNRMLTYLVTLAAVAAVLVVVRGGRRPALRRYAWTLPLGTVAQAVLGGITVLTGLVWWTVALHLLLSMVLVWLAVQLHVGVAVPDGARSAVVVAPVVRRVVVAAAVLLALVLAAGTTVTGAGPHAGDATTPRLDVAITALVHLHGDLVVALLVAVGALAVLLRRAGATALLRRTWLLLAVVLAQGLVGLVQYYTGVPEVLVAVHVAGAGAVTAALAAVWAATTTQVGALASAATASANDASAAARAGSAT
ncbi:heme A synthase [Rhodococcus aerolatus]